MTGKRDRPLAERIAERIEYDPFGGCHLWSGSTAAGYGLISVDGHTEKVHRVVLERKLGHPLGELWALHKCDVRCCCNEDHLFPGTDSDNKKDAGAKGRNGAQTHPETRRGERNSQAKLTDEERAQLRADWMAGASGGVLGRKYGLHRTQALRVATGAKRVDGKWVNP